MFAIYIDDLSLDLAMCTSGCYMYIDDQCMNHVMYADDICLLAPSAIGLQRMLDVCLDFSIRNDIKFNPIKSVCIVFKPKSSKLYCPNVKLDCDTLAGAPNSVKFRGGCRGPAKIRQKGGCNNFLILRVKNRTF